jgi:iron complex outermembrane receptor protein
MMSFKISPLVLAVAAATPAFAQDTNAVTEQSGRILEEVVVTGRYRDSLATALEAKRDAAAAVDAIMAEDIADFPDNNLAESLQRIPGVAISRVAGEGRNITVRGLGPEYTRVRINGMEAIATGGGTDAVGGANRGRGFDFNTFSSDLFSSLVVRKTASADVEEGSLGATVDLNSAKPFDYGDFVFSANAQAGYNDLSEEIDPKVAMLISNVFNDQFGALLSVSYSERTIVDDGASTVRWANANAFGGCSAADCDLETVNRAFRPRLPRYDSYAHEMERLGISGSLQFRPTEATDISLDVLYSQLDASRSEVFMQAILNGNGQTSPMTVVDYEIDGSNTLTYAAFENATFRAENRYDELTTDFTQVTLNASHEFSDRLRGTAMLGRAESEFDNPIQTTVVMEKSGLDFSYDYRGGRRENPELIFGSADASDLNAIDNWGINSVRLRPLGATNTFDVASADLEFDLNDAITLKGGVHFKAFEFETIEARLSTEGAAIPDMDSPAYATAVAISSIELTEANTALYDAGVGPQGTWRIPDLNALASQYGIYDGGPFAVSQQYRLADNYSAEEETLGLWVQLAFATEVNNTPVRGDVGFRYVDTDQSSTAWAKVAGVDQQVTRDHSYDDILPSANLVFEPIGNVLIRVAYAEVMARAGLQSIRPNLSISASGGNRTIQGGNPQLEPTKAKNYDVGVEIYFDEGGAFSAAVFKKEIKSFAQELRRAVRFADVDLPSQWAVDACTAGPGYDPADCSENTLWDYRVPLNGPGGDLYGFEVGYQQPFTFLSGFWRNFGVITNFTYVKAQLDYVDLDGTVLATRNLHGLSESTKSATLYYEQDKFSARISSVTRSSYLTEPLGRNGNDMEGTNATTNVDAAVSYQLTDHWKVSFEALNLTDEVEDQWVDSVGNRLSYYHETGKQFYLGVQYKY